MTLKELFMQVGFDDLLPYLKKHEDKYPDSIYAYREAYDILRCMEPDPDFRGKIHVVSWDGKKRKEGEEQLVRVCYMDDTGWKQDLAKEITVSDDLHLNLPELAMHCLWEITYWGFSPKDQEETWEEMFRPKKLTNPYEIALDKLEERIWNQIPKKFRFIDEDDLKCLQSGFFEWSQRPKNRSKRKREYRQNKRKEYLKRMAARENLVRTFSAAGSNFSRGDMEFLLHVEYGVPYTYHSVTNGTDGRLSYIAESIEKYQQLDLEKYDSAVAGIFFSSRYPLAEKESEEFKKRIRFRLGYADIKFAFIPNDSDHKDIEAILLLNKLGTIN